MPLPRFFGLRFRTLAEIILAGATLISFLVYITVRIVRAMSFDSKRACPGCHSNDVSLSTRKCAWDWVFRLLGCFPYRCQVCSTRYFCAEKHPSAESVSTSSHSANTLGY
jgi:hypothetical protein